MEELYEILNELQPGVDYETTDDLVDGHVLHSLTILALVAELEDTFDITIPAVEIIPENFNSAAAMWNMIERLQKGDWQ